MTHYSIPPLLSRSNAVVRSLALGDTDTGELKYLKKNAIARNTKEHFYWVLLFLQLYLELI